MFCKSCGKEIEDSAVVCPNCGCATDNLKLNTPAVTTGQPSGITEQDKSSPLKRGKYKAAIACTIIGWVFLFVAVGILIYSFTNGNTGENSKEVDFDLLFTFTAIPVFFAEIFMVAAYFSNSNYRTANKNQGIKVSKFWTEIFVFEIIGMIPLLPLLVAFGVYLLVSFIFNKIASIQPSSSSSTIKVKDENGDEHTLTHSSGSNYKDEKGNWWTKDYFDSNKFNKD